MLKDSKFGLTVLIILVLLSFFTTHTIIAGQSFTYDDIVSRCTDLESLALLPRQGEKTMQFSSYNRVSRYSGANDTYISWSKNNDAGTKGAITHTVNGPGVIWRLWSATPESGHVRIYLDSSSTPAVDLPWVLYFNPETPPFNYPSMTFRVTPKGGTKGGNNCYVPMPFSKSCRIEMDTCWGRYYHITYGIFAPDDNLPVYKSDLPESWRRTLSRADSILDVDRGLGSDPAETRSGQVVLGKKVRIGNGIGAVSTVCQLTGPAAITAIKINPSFLSSETDSARVLLRELSIRIYWDNEQNPSVQSPLGDFFGTAPGFNKYKSLPLGMTDSALYCYWYMPFSENAVIQLCNDGHDSHTVDFTVIHAPLNRPVGDFGRFHAKWHRNRFLPERPDRRIDWTLLKTTGRGRFVGSNLHVWNPRGIDSDTLAVEPEFTDGDAWWGEGDEKFFIDGEKFPSTFGTGTEDYYGYAWCSEQYFQTAFISQPLNENNKGHISNNRWHIGDSYPFQSEFEGCIEKYYKEDSTKYAATVYWYLDKDGTDPYDSFPSVAERIQYWKSDWILPPPTTWEDPDPPVASKPLRFQNVPMNRRIRLVYPARGCPVLHIDSRANETMLLQIALFDVRGRAIYTGNRKLTGAGTHRIPLNIDRKILTEGKYVCRVDDGRQASYLTFVITR